MTSQIWLKLLLLACFVPDGMFQEGNEMLNCLNGFLIFVCRYGNIYYVSPHVEEIMGMKMVRSMKVSGGASIQKGQSHKSLLLVLLVHLASRS